VNKNVVFVNKKVMFKKVVKLLIIQYRETGNCNAAAVRNCFIVRK
jgi:hypothetical protein